MSLAIIGGTGLDEMPEFLDGPVETVSTRFGEAQVVISKTHGKDMIFLPRHGLGHATLPSNINYRAQIAALKKIGVTRVIGVCAVGSLRKDISGGTLVVVDDFIDLTKRRVVSFFDEPGEPVVHTDFTKPYCPEISSTLVDACKSAGCECISGGVYIGVDGPRYETPAEIRTYASWGGDVIGMTNVPEAVLAREAGLCYGAICVATNSATGLGEKPLCHDEVRAVMASTKLLMQDVLKIALSSIPAERKCSCSLNTMLAV